MLLEAPPARFRARPEIDWYSRVMSLVLEVQPSAAPIGSAEEADDGRRTTPRRRQQPTATLFPNGSPPLQEASIQFIHPRRENQWTEVCS